MPLPEPSLRARALRYLSQREHSRAELRRKLQRFCDDAEEVEAVIESMAAEHWQDDARFAQSVLHRRKSRNGNLRIAQELANHGLASDLVQEQMATLRGDELRRAQAVWQRRFGGALPSNAQERARQQRFLMGRGFTADTIRAILKGEFADDPQVDSAAD